MPKKSKNQNYVITSAQCCAKPHAKFLTGLERYAKDHDAELVILTMPGMSVREDVLVDELAERNDVFPRHRRPLNSKIFISDLLIPPQNEDPSTGTGRFVQQDKTWVVAHPKQRWRAIPNSNYDLPKLLISTGAVTAPRYNTNNARGDRAKRDHVYGAVMVEVVDDVIFHVRNLRAQPSTGKFVDLGQAYDGNRKPGKSVLEALVLGDIHLGDTDPKVMAANYEMMEQLKPRRLVLHDLFNGHSVNHHNIGKIATQAREIYEAHRQNLEEELRMNYEELCKLSGMMGKSGEILVVASNHNEFLDRYLDQMRFATDPENSKLAAQLYAHLVDGKNPLEVGIRLMGNLPSNIRFLGREDDFKVRGWQLASHGDRGAHGARGSTRAKEFAHGRSITGHTHVPEILRNTYVVGTSTHLNLPYTKGSSSAWMHTNALLYDTGPVGTVQLVNIINGKWRKKK
jgi:hypothetical protein